MPSVLVSAAFSNLGQAIVRRFHADGWTVYGTARTYREDPRLTRLFVLDLAHGEPCFDGIDRLDALVNNAGVFTEAHAWDVDESDIDTVFDLNVKGVMLLTKALIPALKAADGAVVNVSSMNAIHPGFSKTAHYDASKAAVSAYTRSLAAETGLRVNAVQPGLIHRPSLEGSPLEAHWCGHTVRKELMDPDEIASLVSFLATSRGIYGQCVTIDNGYTLC